MTASSRPKMILFDYGNTLLHEPDFDPVRGDMALSGYITENPSGFRPEDISAYARKIFLDAQSAREASFEMHEHAMLRLVNDSLGIRYSLTIEEQEAVFWANASNAEPLPHIALLLKKLDCAGIRTAVVSNISFSEKALRRKIDEALPENCFEFVIASSEYCIRKPNPMLFQVALKRAGLSPEEVWFCGDNLEADVKGASSAGIFPVWYRGAYDESEDEINSSGSEWLTIRDWQAFARMLDI